MEQTKVCNKCQEEKPNTEFSTSKNGKYGTHSTCKKCKCAYAAEKWKNDQGYRDRVKNYSATPERREYYRKYMEERRKIPEIREKNRLAMIEYWKKK